MLVSSHLYHLLGQLRDQPVANWVLATVVTKFRSSYRQPGAMMLVNPEGQSLGLVSGGCLEADIRLNARKVRSLNRPKCLLYDSTDETNIAAELGLGCNGRVEILIQQLKAPHRDLLLQLLQRMEQGKDSFLLQCFRSPDPEDLNSLALLDEEADLILSTSGLPLPELQAKADHQTFEQDCGRHWSLHRHNHPVNLWVFGGGVDAQSLVSMAASLGWKISLADHRPAYAKASDFPLATNYIQQRPTDFGQNIDADAAIIMTHNLELDAAWLNRLQACTRLRYIGLLGPRERRDEVIKLANIDPDSAILSLLYGPMGFDIGGDIPESVALSTLAQCHQILFREPGGK